MSLVSKHDEYLEQTVLASVLLDSSFIEDDRSKFPIEAFYIESHREIWQVMQRCYKEYGRVDLALFGDSLKPSEISLLRILITADGDARMNPAFTSLAYKQYVHRLMKIYVEREKALALKKYEGEIAGGRSQVDAHIEFNARIETLDSLVGGSESSSVDAGSILSSAPFPSGFGDADRLSGGLTNPGLNIIAARPSVGKTSMARSIVRFAAGNGKRVFWYSLDQSVTQVMLLEASRLLDMSTSEIMSQGTEFAPRLQWALDEVTNKLWGGNVVITDKGVPLDVLINDARIAQPDLVVIDYLQIIKTSSDNEYESVTLASKALKGLALDLGIPVLALAQLNRRGAEGNPSISDIRASGQIEQDADQIWMLERDTSEDRSVGRVNIAKNKTGPTGSFLLTWLPDRAEYVNHARDSRGH